jgi:hypothetical protein
LDISGGGFLPWSSSVTLQWDFELERAERKKDESLALIQGQDLVGFQARIPVWGLQGLEPLLIEIMYPLIAQLGDFTVWTVIGTLHDLYYEFYHFGYLYWEHPKLVSDVCARIHADL